MTNQRSKYGAMFLIAGAIVTFLLFFLMDTPMPGLSGWGDGAHDSSISYPPGLILPYSSYFLCGFIAAFLALRWVRFILAVVAHAAPFASQRYASYHDGPIFIGIDVVTFIIFGFAWFQILRKDDHAA
jgi:hypothetical protein